MTKKNVLIGMALGAVAAYVAGPQRGRRRRATARHQIARAGRTTRDALDATGRRIANRTTDVLAAGRARWSSESVEDKRLIERVRAKLGLVASHPRAIDVAASDGIVTLRGPVLASEIDSLLATVWAVRGVLAVNNGLEGRASSDGIPAPQGNGEQRSWAPATRALVAAAGLAATGLAMAAYARRSS